MIYGTKIGNIRCIVSAISEISTTFDYYYVVYHISGYLKIRNVTCGIVGMLSSISCGS